MDDLCRFAHRPAAFCLRYIRRHPWSHSVIVVSMLAAVACSVSAQYGVKFLVDTLAARARDSNAVWIAFAVLVVLIAADNLLWRLASWVGSYAFVKVTGDLRRDLFRHLTGHAPSYFAERLPGTLTSRVTATSNAVFTIENMFVWNVLPPCAATVVAIIFIFTVSAGMAATMAVMACILVFGMFRFAAAGGSLHHDFAHKAAAVDGEMIDVIGNMPLVWAFGGASREHRRFDATIEGEMAARQRSLIYLEKLRLTHAVITVMLVLALLAWAITLWQRGDATTGEVVLVCTLGLSVLHATRDLAVALVDVTQHMARLSEAVATLLTPHALRDHPQAKPLIRCGARVSFERMSFHYPDGHRVFSDFNLEIEPGQRVGLVGRSGSGKSTLLSLLQRFYAVQGGAVRIDGQDISRVTQQSLRAAIATVPQDLSLFHRSILENVRYGRPDASDDEVMSALAAARCDFIDAMPEGVATTVGERGIKLSPGQRQRIAIARAFLKDAPTLLLDEATSSLDIDSEEAIREALDGLMHGRTVVAIAHRLSTLRNFDRIIVMQDGQVLEDGAPQKLMQHGIYRDLVRREMSRLSKQAA